MTKRACCFGALAREFPGKRKRKEESRTGARVRACTEDPGLSPAAAVLTRMTKIN